MDRLNNLLNELGVSKVRLAKYLGVSRQMLYNYLALNSLGCIMTVGNTFFVSIFLIGKDE